MLRISVVLALLVTAFSASHVWADSSGPNPSGYFWFDNNGPGPMAPYAWVDATGGTLTGSTDDDDGYDTVALPFTFTYFGVDHTMIDIGTNGLLSFNIGNGCNDNYNWSTDDLGHTIPHGDATCEDGADGWGGNPLIAAWFDDLDPGECGDVYYQTVGSMPNRRFIVEYDDVCHNDCDVCLAGEGVTFEVILYEGTNDIKVQYMDALFGTTTADITEENYGGTSTVGLNKDATVGLQYLNASPDLSNGLAVLYTQATDVGNVSPTCTTDDVVDPVDATLILQFAAGLIDTFTCPANAYANSDANVDPIDGLLVLQLVAGLIDSLPV